MRSQTAYLVVLMAMMACFALYRLDERAFVLLPGNLAVFAGLAGGALSLALGRKLWLPLSLLGAGLAAGLGVLGLLQGGTPLSWMRLPGSPAIWMVVGLYCAFRLAVVYQQKQRQQTAQRQEELRKKQELADLADESAAAQTEPVGEPTK